MQLTQLGISSSLVRRVTNTQARDIVITNISDVAITINWTNGVRSSRLVVVSQSTVISTDPSDNTTYTANTVFGSGTQIGTGNYVVYAGPGTSVTVTGLTANSLYTFRVYEFSGGAGSEDYDLSYEYDNPYSDYSFTTEYQAYNDRLTTLAYTKPPVSLQIARNNNVRLNKESATWTTREAYWLFIGAGSQEAACVNLITPSSFEASRVSSPVYSDLLGFTTNGSSSYIDTNYTPSGAGSYTQNNAALLAYFSNEAQNSNSSIANISNTNRRILLSPRNTSDQTSFFINDNTVSQASNSRAKGFYHAFRSTSAARSLYKNNASLASGVGGASTGLPTVDIYLGCRNNAGVADSFWSGSIGSFSAGSSMSTAMGYLFANSAIYLMDAYTAIESGQDQIGELFNDYFDRASLGSSYASAGAATWAANGTTGTVTGGTNVYVNRLRRVFPNSFDRWDQSVTITLTSAPATNNGHGIGFSDYHTPDVEQSILCRFDTSNGVNAGKIYIYTFDGSNETQRAGSANALSVANGDSFKIRFRKHYVNGYYLYAAEVMKMSDASMIMVAWTTDNVISTVTLTEATGDFAQFSFGGSYTFSPWKTIVHDQKNIDDLYVGDSITKGYAATDLSTNWANKTGMAQGNIYNISAGSGDITQRFLDKVPAIILQKPSRVIVMIGGNDILLGVAQATREANFTSAVMQLEAAGITVVICKATPRTPTDVTGWNTFLDTFTSNLVIDTYTPLWSGSSFTLNPAYDGGGGVHPNQAGMDVIFATVDAAL